MDADVPLVDPRGEPRGAGGTAEGRIVAIPNCTTITAMLAVGPLHRAAGCRSLMLSSYQSVCGAGWKGTRELAEQIEKLHGQEEVLGHPEAERAARGGGVRQDDRVQRASPRSGSSSVDGYTGEEAKIMAEPRKILSAPDLAGRGDGGAGPGGGGSRGVIGGGVLDRAIAPEEAREVLRSAPGVELRDEPANGIYPSPLEAAGMDVALVGRIRQVPDRNDALMLFSCADNLRKGAALNAVQIAEHLFLAESREGLVVVPVRAGRPASTPSMSGFTNHLP